jgi:hypothetical protein
MLQNGYRGALQRTANAKTRPTLSKRERMVFFWSIAIFLAIIADGALRKWVLPPRLTLQAIPYFAKDVLVGLFLLGHARPKKARWTKHLTPFILGIFVCLLPALLVGLNKGSVGAIVIFKNAVMWPLFAVRMGSYLTQNVTQRLWKFALACTIPMAVLAGAQYFSGPASILNRYAWDDITLLGGTVAIAGGFVRATGTFSYLAGLAAFSMAMFCLFVGRSLSARRGPELWLAISGLAGAVVCGLATGSRVIQVFMAAVIAAVMIFVPKRHSIRLFGALLGAGVVIAVLWHSSLSQGVLSRWTHTDEEEFRSRATPTSLGQPIIETLSSDPIGIGLGSYSGIAAYNGSTEELAYNEYATNKVATEAGILGMIAIALGIGLVLRASLWTLALQDSWRKSRLLPIATGTLIQLVIGLWYDHTATGLWWWTIGLWLGDALVSVKVPRTVAKPALGLAVEAAR